MMEMLPSGSPERKACLGAGSWVGEAPVRQAADQESARTGSLVAVFRAAIPLSIRSLNHLADLIRTHRQQCRSHWHRLEPGRQALLALGHLRNGGTFTRPAAGFEIGVATAWRYVRKAINLLAATADGLQGCLEERLLCERFHILCSPHDSSSRDQCFHPSFFPAQ